jgi:hypothetical protein
MSLVAVKSGLIVSPRFAASLLMAVTKRLRNSMPLWTDFWTNWHRLRLNARKPIGYRLREAKMVSILERIGRQVQRFE